MFNISEAKQTDIPDIREIAERTWWPAYSTILPGAQIRYMLDTLYAFDALKKEMTAGTQTFLLLTDENGARAFASYGMRNEAQTVYKLHRLYVLPEARQRGYGRSLVEHIQNRLREKKIHTLDLNVNRFNPARTFYEKLGFTTLYAEDIPIGPYWMNDYVMRLTF